MRALALALVSCLPAFAQDLSGANLDKLKNATVLVTVPGSRGTAFGSGFLFLSKGGSGYVISCAHVVEGADFAQVVFSSGSKSERTFTADVVATDPDRDLACLKFTAKELPTPLELGTKTTVKETQTIFVAGFPFGDMLALGNKNPEITISKSTVSSIRRDDRDEIALVQMAGEINPGNSGGPVVDASCKVVGVTQSKIGGTQTAFAVTPEALQGFLRGRVKNASYRPLTQGPTTVKMEVVVEVVDPLGSLRSVGIGWVREDLVKTPIPEKPDGRYDKISSSMKEVTIKIEGDRGTGTFEVTRTKADPMFLPLQVQAHYIQSDGTSFWTGPGPLEIEFLEEAASAPPSGGTAVPEPKEGPAAKGAELDTLDEGAVISTLPLCSVLSDIYLSKDGATLWVLDLSEGKVYRIEAATLKVALEVQVPEGVVAMDLTPNEKTLYVVVRDAGDIGAYEQKGSGVVVTLDAKTLKTSGTFHIDGTPVDVEATDSGLLFISVIQQWDGLFLVDAGKKSVVGVDRSAYGGAYLRLTPDQGRVYYGSTGLSPGDFHCVPVSRDAKKGIQEWDSPYHGDYPLGGRFEISPDGRFLIGCGGAVLRLARTREADMKYVAKVDPFLGCALASAVDTFFTSTNEGFLKQYSLSSFELQKSIKTDGVLCPFVLDGKKCVLYGALQRPSTDSSRGYRSSELGVGDLVAITLKKR